MERKIFTLHFSPLDKNEPAVDQKRLHRSTNQFVIIVGDFNSLTSIFQSFRP